MAMPQDRADADARKSPQMNANGPGSACRTEDSMSAEALRAAPLRNPQSHPRSSAAICVHPRFPLALSHAAPSNRGGRTCTRANRTPCTRRRCRPSGRRAKAAQNPMHQTRPCPPPYLTAQEQTELRAPADLARPSGHPAQPAPEPHAPEDPAAVRPPPAHASRAGPAAMAMPQERADADARKSPQMNADGPGSRVRHRGLHVRRSPGELHRFRTPSPIRVHLRRFACICVSLLLCRMPHRAAGTSPAGARANRTPCTRRAHVRRRI